MTTQTRVEKGVPSGGEFTARAHGAPVISLPPAGVERFPHPDKKYPHPMNQWPEGLEEPASIELGSAEQFMGYSGNTWYKDPQTEIHKDLPAVTITMANGAKLTLQQTNEADFPETEASFSGDWDTYTQGDKFTRDEILDTASETLTQAAI